MRIAQTPPTSAARFASTLTGPQDRVNDFFVSSSQERFEHARSSYHRELVTQGLTRGVIGGVAGYAFSGGALWAPVAGAAIGLYTAWESQNRENKGNVTVHLDGQQYSKPFYGDPGNYQLSPKESEFMSLARGTASPSAVTPLQNPQIPAASPEQLAPWKTGAGALRELAGQRRLVATLGGQTQDGQKSAHIVDSISAARIAATGGQVYIVDAKPAQTVDHQLALVALNGSQSKANSEDYRYQEKTVDYSLTALTNPAQLANPGKAEGVPEGMFGLLRDKTSYSEITSFGDTRHISETQSPEFGTGGIRHSDHIDSSSRRRTAEGVQTESMIRTTHHLNFPALLGLAGSCAGMITAMSLVGPGVPGPVVLGGAVGFLAGRATGRFINNHTPALGESKRELARKAAEQKRYDEMLKSFKL